MLRWSLAFFIVAIIAAVLGFGGIAGSLATVAKVLFVVALVLMIAALIAGVRSPAAV